MSQFFSFERFRLLVLKHWADNKRRYTLSVLAFIGLLFAWFIVTLLLSEDGGALSPDVQEGTYFFLLFVGGSLYTSQYFSHLASRTKAGNLLLLPASTFEKLLCGILYTAVLFFLVFTAAFYVADSLAIAVANAFLDEGQKAELVNIFTIRPFHFYNENQALNVILFFFSVQSVFLLGSVHFRKYSLIKTIISFFLIWLLGFALLYVMHQLGVLDFEGEMPHGMVLLIIFLAYAFAPLLWLATYFRLKAKQA